MSLNFTEKNSQTAHGHPNFFSVITLLAIGLSSVLIARQKDVSIVIHFGH
mgnify:CR=1 FL=1